jgi:hypothetical protein
MSNSTWANDATETKEGSQTDRKRHPLEPKDEWNNTVPPVSDQVDSEARSAGVRDIVSGAVLIGIGLAMGGSVFTGGDPTILDWMFYILGSFWVLKGIVGIARA